MATLHIAESTKAKLDQLASSLTKTLGDNLVALVVHGSAVRGGWRDGASDVDLVLVLRDDAESVLAAIGPALELARSSARIETMILTAAEIPRSADCFPLLYGDIARHGVAIAGTSPFAGLSISHAHIRLRIEQELRELRIRMRRVVTDIIATPTLAGMVDRKLKQARGPLSSLLALRGDGDHDEIPDVLAKLGAAYEVDASALQQIRDNPKGAYTALAKLLDAALADVDAREGS